MRFCTLIVCHPGKFEVSALVVISCGLYIIADSVSCVFRFPLEHFEAVRELICTGKVDNETVGRMLSKASGLPDDLVRVLNEPGFAGSSFFPAAEGEGPPPRPSRMADECPDWVSLLVLGSVSVPVHI